MKKEFKRMLSILLVLTLLGSTLPMSVSASALPTQNASAIENQEPTDASQNDTQNDAQDVTQNETQNEAQTEEAQESQQEVQAYANTLPSTIPAGETYTLSEDVTMESGQWFESIEGTLDGAGHTITLTDKPLANKVTGTIQNLGVTSEKVIERDDTFGSMAMTFSGTIQNCFSTAKLNMAGFDEPGGLVGTANGGVIQNSYFAGTVTGMLSGFYGGLIGVNNSNDTKLKNSCYGPGSMNGAVSMGGNKITPENVQQKSLEDFKSGAANSILNTNLPETGFSWATPTDGSNQGFPILVKGGSTEAQKPDKTNLQKLADTCSALSKEGYTKESWIKLEEALANAQNVLKNEDATLEEVTTATATLQAAKDGLKKERPTEPVAPPADASQIQHISTENDLSKINSSSDQYYVLDQDITIKDSYFSMTEFNGILDGQGHAIIFENANWMFQHLGEEGVLQNLYFTGTIDTWEQSGNGPIGQNLKGTVINCFSDVKGSLACGFAKRLQGGSIINSYSISEGKKGVLFNQYKEGTLKNTYWQEGLANPAEIPAAALNNSSAKSEEQLKTKDFVTLLNQNRGANGTKWGQNSNGYPYFGEDKTYNPDKPNLPENKYEMVMVTEAGETLAIENQTFTVSPDEVNAFGIVGNFQLKNVPETSTISWGISEVKPEGSLMIGADNGDLRIDKEGSATVTATETKADGSSEAVAWVKVISKAQKLEEIKLFIDGQDVTNQTCQVAGSEEKKIEVKAKYQGSDAFVPANSTRFAYKASDDSLIKNYNDSSSFSFKKPGTAKMVVTSKVNNSITAEVEVTSTYVPATSVKPAISGKKVIHGRNANDPDQYAFLPDYSGVIVSPQNASYADNWKVTSSDDSIAEYVESMVKGYVPYKAGTVTYRATLTQTDPETKKESTVSGTSDVTYAYENPLTEVTAVQDKVSMENFTEQPLELNFKGEKSDAGWSVTYPDLKWTFDKKGIVKIYKKEPILWKKGTEWEGAPDFNSVVTNDQYYVKALKEGTVVATGTPLDNTNSVAPIQITIEVAGGETPQINIDELVQKGLLGAKAHLQAISPEQNYECIEHDWIVYDLLRAGIAIPEEKQNQYYDSVVKTVKGWKANKKPTEIERVALVLSVMNKDITDVGGVNLAEMIYNHPNLNSGSNETAWALLALDAKKTPIPSDAKWNREQIISALLTFQNPDNGGFGLTDNKTAGVDTTAMALQALAPYRQTNEAAKNAIDAGLAYLKSAMSDSYDMGTAESTSQLLLTLIALQIDPLNSEFGTSYSNAITSLMDYYCDTTGATGFCHDKTNKKRNDMASVQAFQALSAYVHYKNGGKFYWDLSEDTKEVTAATVMQAIDQLPELNELTLEDEATIQAIENLYQQLSEEEKQKVTNLDVLKAARKRIEALKDLGDQKGTVSLTIMDGIQADTQALRATEDPATVRGTILDVQVPIYAQDSMMSIIQRACEENEIDISLRFQGTYIERIDGLSEFDRGPGSGWKGTLDGIFPNKSFAQCTVQNGEVKDHSVITVEYTENLGEDLEANAELKTLGLQGGNLKETFERDRYEYTLLTNQDEISFTPEFFNRYSVASIEADGVAYGVSQQIPVKVGTQIQLVSEKNVRGTDRRTYTFLIEAQGEEKPGEQEKPDTPEKPGESEKPDDQQTSVTLLSNKEYGISLKGEGLTDDMELSVKPIKNDHEDVALMKKELPTNKSLFCLYEVKLLKNGKEIRLPKKATLSVSVGKEYEGKEMTLLHCVNGKVESLKGTVKDKVLSVEISSLGTIGVVTDAAKTQTGNNKTTSKNNKTTVGNGNTKKSPGTTAAGSGSATSAGKSVKTGDELPLGVTLLMLLVSAGALGTVGYKKRKERK